MYGIEKIMLIKIHPSRYIKVRVQMSYLVVNKRYKIVNEYCHLKYVRSL